MSVNLLRLPFPARFLNQNRYICGPNRGVAQPGSALRSGRRGRGFESRHPDIKKTKRAMFGT